MSAACISRASSEGFSQFTSSAMRADVGALLAGSTPLTISYGIAGVPRPIAVVCGTDPGREALRWLEYLASHYGTDVVAVHLPPSLRQNDPGAVDAASQQMLRAVDDLERLTGHTLDMSALQATVELSARAARLWREILDLARWEPTPFTAIEAFEHAAPMLLLRGTEEAVSYYESLKTEIQHRISSGVAAVPGERFRFYWDGPPIWHSLPALSQLFRDSKAAVVASTHCEAFALSGLDPERAIESMALAYTGVFDNCSDSSKAAILSSSFDGFGIDAAVFHDCRTSIEANHVRYGLPNRMQQTTGIPSLVIESDSHDERLFSNERVQEVLSAFIEERLSRVATP